MLAQLSSAQDNFAGRESNRSLLLQSVRFRPSLHATHTQKNLSGSHDISSSTRNSGHDVDPEFFGQGHILRDKKNVGNFRLITLTGVQTRLVIFLSRYQSNQGQSSSGLNQIYRTMCLEQEQVGNINTNETDHVYIRLDLVDSASRHFFSAANICRMD